MTEPGVSPEEVQENERLREALDAIGSPEGRDYLIRENEELRAQLERLGWSIVEARTLLLTVPMNERYYQAQWRKDALVFLESTKTMSPAFRRGAGCGSGCDD